MSSRTPAAYCYVYPVTRHSIPPLFFVVLPLFWKHCIFDLDMMAKGLWMVLITFVGVGHDTNRIEDLG